MRRVDPDEDLLPLAVVESGTDKDSLPTIQQGGVQIKPSVVQYQDVGGRSISERQNTIWQRSLEPQMNIIPFIPGCVHNQQTLRSKRHRRSRVTSLTLETLSTRAVELVLRFILQIRYACSSVQARLPLTPGQLHRTILATPQPITVTVIVVPRVQTRSMNTRMVLQALIDIRLTVESLETWLTITCIIANSIHASPVLARTAVALVDVDLAVLAHRPGHTHAIIPAGIRKREPVPIIHRQAHIRRVVQRHVRALQTPPGVLTRIRFALANVLLAVLPDVAREALALVVVHLVDALGSVRARIRLALVDVVLAQLARVARLVAVAQEVAELVDAAAVVLARLGLEGRERMLRRSV